MKTIRYFTFPSEGSIDWVSSEEESEQEAVAERYLSLQSKFYY